MRIFRVRLEAVQHIEMLTLEIDLTKNGLICLVGRNGTGKTTLIRALRNLSISDTFLKTANPHAFSTESRITYEVDGAQIVYTYDPEIRSLNCKSRIPVEVRRLITAELPIPHGTRFNYSKSASEADLDIRRSIALGSYNRPHELIEFLTAIYASEKYAAMAEVRVRGKSYYAIAQDNGTYIREDYLSSGEYFIINLYRTIKGSAQLIAIDEIDLSLDAAAQVNITAWLRIFCATYEKKILFTTHSLALMRTLEADELYYIGQVDGRLSVDLASYSYVKAILFGFTGWDKYILTEDVVLLEFIEEIIKKYCPSTFYRYKVIFIGGASQVVSLMQRNATENFLAAPESVVTILDGDQRNRYTGVASVYMIPIESVEKDLYAEWYADANFPFSVSRRDFKNEKSFFKHLQRERIATQQHVFDYLIARNDAALQPLVGVLSALLATPA